MQRTATHLSELEKKEWNWNRINLEASSELRFELFPWVCSSVEEKLGLREACGGRGKPFPPPLSFTFPAGEETSTSLTAHAIRLSSLYLMQEVGVCRTCGEGEKMGIRQGEQGQVGPHTLGSWFSLPLTSTVWVSTGEAGALHHGAKCPFGPGLREGEGGFRRRWSNSDLAAASHPQSESASEWQHMWITKWPLLHFHHPNLAPESLMAQPNQEPAGKEILGNAVYPTHIDSLQILLPHTPPCIKANRCEWTSGVWRQPAGQFHSGLSLPLKLYHVSETPGRLDETLSFWFFHLGWVREWHFKSPSDADNAGPGTTLWKPLV